VRKNETDKTSSEARFLRHAPWRVEKYNRCHRITMHHAKVDLRFANQVYAVTAAQPQLCENILHPKCFKAQSQV